MAEMPGTAPAVAPPIAPMAPPPAAGWKDVVTLDGLVDSYYMFNFSQDGNTLSGPNVMPMGSPFSGVRAFDTQANSFTLAYAKLGVGASVENVAFRADLGYGHTGAIVNGLSASSSSGAAGALLYGNGFIVQQAFASATFGQLTLDFGKFVTTAGSEVIESNKNWLYSRSLLFNMIQPSLHTGLRVNFKANDMVSIQASVVNGWNNDPDINGDKTFGLSVSVTPIQPLNLVATGYFGKETAMGPAMTDDVRMLIDLVAAYSLNDQVGLNLNVDILKEGDPTTIGVSGMGRFVLHQHAVLALRGEMLNFDSGIDGADPTKIYEATLGAAFPWAGRYELRAEVRGDFASEDIFFDGMVAQGNQFTGTVAALATF